MAELQPLNVYSFTINKLSRNFINLARRNKTFYMLSSAEHEILNAHKCENIKKFSIFRAQKSLECFFFLLTNVKMPRNVGILTFMSRKYFMGRKNFLLS